MLKVIREQLNKVTKNQRYCSNKAYEKSESNNQNKKMESKTLQLKMKQLPITITKI